MDERGIIELFFARSEDAVAELLKKYGSALKKIAYGILNDARDAEVIAPADLERRRGHDRQRDAS